MGSLLSEALQHFGALSLTQILRADREIFSILAAEHKGDIKGKPIEVPPLDEAFRRLMSDSRINVHLVPLLKGTKRLDIELISANLMTIYYHKGRKVQRLPRGQICVVNSMFVASKH